MAQKYLDQSGLEHFMQLIKTWGQPMLVSETNIKSISSGEQKVSILGSGTLQFRTLNGETIIGSSNIPLVTINNESIVADKNLQLQLPLTFQNGIGIEVSNQNNTVISNLLLATSDTLGGIKVGYSSSDKNYAVQLSESNQAFVNVPWIDNIADNSNKGLAPAIGNSGIVGQQFVVLSANEGQVGWYTLPSTAFSTGEGVNVVNKDITFNWGEKSILATINSIEITASLPSNPNKDLVLEGEVLGSGDDMTGYKITLKSQSEEVSSITLPVPSTISNSDIDSIISTIITSFEETEDVNGETIESNE